MNDMLPNFQEVKERYCPACGHVIPGLSGVRCPRCGKPLGSARSSTDRAPGIWLTAAVVVLGVLLAITSMRRLPPRQEAAPAAIPTSQKAELSSTRGPESP